MSSAHATPDPVLLDPMPFPRVDAEGLRQSLVFAFATGDAGDVFDRVADEMPLAESSWEPRDFARDVFLAEVLDRCFPILIQGQRRHGSRQLLFRIVSAPPKDRAVVAFRQAIFRELVLRPDLRGSMERLYIALVHLRSLLSKTGTVRIDAFERRLAILKAIRDVIALAAMTFPNASSGIARIEAWGRAAQAGPGYARLIELLAYEQNMAELDVRLQLGFDGRIRHFEVVTRREPSNRAFHHSAGSRWLQKLGLFVRGERFDDHELFARLMDDVFDGIAGLLPPLFPLVGDLEFFLGGMGFRDGASRAGLDVSLPSFVDDARALDGLFNPLLVSEGTAAIPCDLRAERRDALVIVTGPNSGGKTRLLQSIALTQIMAQAGTFVPASRAELPWTSGLFVSLIEHAHADQREGRLGTELLRIRSLFKSLRMGSLVVLDELCSGTNPSEGEEIFRLVVTLLGELRPAAFITTHFLAFASRLAAEASPLEFIQVELDEHERPTYGFVPGVAKTSLAHRTAVRLGVTEEALRSLLVENNPGLQAQALSGERPRVEAPPPSGSRALAS